MLFPLRRLRRGKIQRRAAHRHLPFVAPVHPGLHRATTLQRLQPLPSDAAQAQSHCGLVQFEFRRVVIDVMQAARGRARDLMFPEQRMPLQPGKLLRGNAQFEFGFDCHVCLK